MMRRICSYIVLVMIMAELVLTLVSWIISAMMMEGVRSMLSNEGVRWYLGHFTNILISPFLIYIILLSISIGCLNKSRIFVRANTYHERLGHKIAFTASILYIILIATLAFMPHSILLSATGLLFPSPFSNALIPLLSFGGILVSVCHGFTTHQFSSFHSVVNAACDGIGIGAPFILCYIMIIQFYASILFVFG